MSRGDCQEVRFSFFRVAERPLGDFIVGWRSALAASGLGQIELSPSLAELLSAKDPSEISFTKRAAIFSAAMMHKHLTPKLEEVVDKEQCVSHEVLAQGVEDAFAEPMKLGVKLNAELLEPCYTPIIQSGEFDLKPSASSNGQNLFYGVITCSLGGSLRPELCYGQAAWHMHVHAYEHNMDMDIGRGHGNGIWTRTWGHGHGHEHDIHVCVCSVATARYKSYCANVGRTYVINPSKGVEKLYAHVLGRSASPQARRS